MCNKWLWDKVDISPFGVKANALNMLNDWKRAQQILPNCTQSQQQNNSKFWSKQSPGWIKINVDAACVPGAGYIGIGCVVRNESGAFVKAIQCPDGKYAG